MRSFLQMLENITGAPPPSLQSVIKVENKWKPQSSLHSVIISLYSPRIAQLHTAAMKPDKWTLSADHFIV